MSHSSPKVTRRGHASAGRCPRRASSPAHIRRSASRSSYSARPVVRPDCPISTAYQGPLWNLVALDLDRRLVADLLPRGLPEERRPRPRRSRPTCSGVTPGMSSSPGWGLPQTCFAHLVEDGRRSGPVPRPRPGRRRSPPGAAAASPSVGRAAPATRWAGAARPPPGAASPGPARPTAAPPRAAPPASRGPGPGRCCGSSPGRPTGGPARRRPDPGGQLAEVGLPHVVLLRQVLGQPLLDEAERPLRLLGLLASALRGRSPAARRRPPAWTSSRPGSRRRSSGPRSRRRGCRSRAAPAAGTSRPGGRPGRACSPSWPP